MQPSVIFGAGLLVVACADPTHEAAIDALGPEVAGVPKGPTHRPGQPCLTCHGESGPSSLVMSFGGTVFAHQSGKEPAISAVVRVLDAQRRTFETRTNSAGNFWIPKQVFEPVFPVNASVTLGQYSRVMRTTMRLDGSCNACHVGAENSGSPGHVWVLPDTVNPSENPGNGNEVLGGEAGVVPPCPTNAIECPAADPPPTYTNDVAPILAAHCTGCHGPGGENQDVPLTSYALLMKRSGTSTRAQTAIADIQNCKMPPAPLPRLSEAERTTLVCWFARGLVE
jgi:hypothetical protein